MRFIIQVREQSSRFYKRATARIFSFAADTAANPVVLTLSAVKRVFCNSRRFLKKSESFAVVALSHSERCHTTFRRLFKQPAGFHVGADGFFVFAVRV